VDINYYSFMKNNLDMFLIKVKVRCIEV